MFVLSRPLHYAGRNAFYHPTKYRPVPRPAIMAAQPFPGAILFSHRNTTHGGFSVSDAVTGFRAGLVRSMTRRGAERLAVKETKRHYPQELRLFRKAQKRKVRILTRVGR